MRKYSVFGIPLLGLSFCLFLNSSTAQAQCSDGSTVINWVDSVRRVGGNAVEATMGTQVTGDYSDYWGTFVTGQVLLNGNTIATGSDSAYYGENHIPGAGGTAAGFIVDFAPSAYGAGTYATSLYHEVTSDCEDFFFTFTGNVLTVNKPTINGSLTEWWLGTFGETQTGFGNQATLTASSNCGSSDYCPETPFWSDFGNTNAIALSCDSCGSTTIYAEARSESFQDIQLSVDYGGFSSDEVPFTVYAPYQITCCNSITDEQSEWPYDDGYKTTVYLSLYDRFGDQLTGLAVNENFSDRGIADYPGYNWGLFVATGYASPGWGVLFDKMSVFGNCVNVTPFCSNPSTPVGYVKAMHNLQSWQAGASTIGGGIQVRTDTQQYYGDHARHENDVSPTNP